MNDLGQAASLAVALILGGDGGIWAVVALSLKVSLSASLAAFGLGAPLGAALAVIRFPGRGFLVVAANAALGLPPVVVGLVVYLALSRSGPLGSWGLLFTPAAMVIAQTTLALPIVIALVHRLGESIWREYGDQLRADGADTLRALREVLAIGRAGLITVFLAAFGRAIAEVGAILVVGGNIQHFTRTMTTAIALETSKGDLPLALALGLILVSLSLAVSATTFSLGRWMRA